MFDNEIVSIEKKTINKLIIRFIPFLFLIFIFLGGERFMGNFTYSDMLNELNLPLYWVGLAFGVSTLTFLIFAIPSNIIMHKVGTKIWLPFLILLWGITTVLTGFINNFYQLIFLKALLGIAKAGIFPGILLFITYWFPKKHLAKAFSLTFIGSIISFLVIHGMATLILRITYGSYIHTWRWIFILEGILIIVIGITGYFILRNNPNEADFLKDIEKNWLLEEMEKEKNKREEINVFLNKGVWYLIICYILFTFTFSVSQMFIYQPESIISIISFVISIIAIVIISYHSDKVLERRYHAIIPMGLAFLAILAPMFFNIGIYLKIFLLALIIIGIYNYEIMFWTIPAGFLKGKSAAIGLAFIYVIGSLGGIIFPVIFGNITSMMLVNTPNIGFIAWNFIMLLLLLILTLLTAFMPRDINS
ncbi:MAG TPA: MFS transporter [Clostridia bacterium]|nr:MFS transporter [Clostridia bacterium]